MLFFNNKFYFRCYLSFISGLNVCFNDWLSNIVIGFPLNYFSKMHLYSEYLLDFRISDFSKYLAKPPDCFLIDRFPFYLIKYINIFYLLKKF